MDISRNIAGIKFKNPIMPASGCFGFGEGFEKKYDLSILGGITIKSATPEERIGHPAPFIAKTASGMLNAVGLKNPGVDRIITEKLPRLEKYDTNIIANIAGRTIEDYLEVIEKLNDNNTVDIFELNISCPNVNHGGMSFGSDAKSAYEITSKAKKIAKKPVFVKLSPNVTDIVDIAKAVEEGGADAIVLINTILGMKIDIKTKKPILTNKTGGLSGPAIKPVAIRMVYQVYEAVNIPIIGVGGISSVEDVIAFFLAGAQAVQIGMKNYENPYICKEIIEKLPQRLKDFGFNSLDEAIGAAHE